MLDKVHLKFGDVPIFGAKVRETSEVGPRLLEFARHVLGFLLENNFYYNGTD